MKTTSRILLVLAVSALASSCSSSRKFQCPAPQGISCRSTLELYEATDGASTVSTRKGRAVEESRPYRQPRRATPRTQSLALDAEVLIEPVAVTSLDEPSAELRAPPPQPARVLPGVSLGAETPLRTPARTLRVWIKPYETAEGDLNLGGYVMTEIEPRRWRVGNSQASGSDRMVYPLETEAAIASAPAAQQVSPPKAGLEPAALSIDE